MVKVLVEQMTRRFGDYVALNGVSFEVKSGEFLTLLGPSGCGKSTTLGALAGLDRPTAGKITIGDRAVFDSQKGIFVDAQYRKLGLMFQSYALWPHMTVFKNLDFALELRNVRGKAAKDRIEEVLSMVDMQPYADRYPGELSGGQQQRVALARTLAYRPEVLLLDEPLSNLDAKLREKARIWLGELQRKTGVTTVYVTHDQAEALSLSDRIIVMNGGSIAQIGVPKDIYDRPANAFVADFVGGSNLIEATRRRGTSGAPVAVIDGNMELEVSDNDENRTSGAVTISVRPESMKLVPKIEPNALPYRMLTANYLGARTLYVVKVGEQVIRVDQQSSFAPDAGYLVIPPDAMRIFAV